MQTSRAKTIRGLSIAVVILSAISIVGSLFCLVFLGVGGVALSDPELQGMVDSAIYVDPESAAEMERLNLDSSDVMGMMGVLLGLGSAYIIWAIICSIVSLIAGIMGIRNCDKIEKLGGTFGWAIAGAVVSFLYGNIITCVLLVISAVCISRDRKAATAIPYGQPAAYTQMNQPYYGAPQQPYAGQPQQPYVAQPGQPYGAQPAQAPYYGQQPMQAQAQPQQFQPQQPAAAQQPVQAQTAEPQPQPVEPQAEQPVEPQAAEPQAKQAEQPQAADEQGKQQ